MPTIIEFSGICRHLTWSCLEQEHDYCDTFEFVKGEITYHLTIPHCRYPPWGRVRHAADYVEEVAGDELLKGDHACGLFRNYSPGRWQAFEELHLEAYAGPYTRYFWRSDVEKWAHQWEQRCVYCDKPVHEWQSGEPETQFKDFLQFQKGIFTQTCSDPCTNKWVAQLKRQERNTKRKREREAAQLRAQKALTKGRIEWLRRAQTTLRETRKTIRTLTNPSV